MTTTAAIEMYHKGLRLDAAELAGAAWAATATLPRR
jgi:hypothetical protein